MRGDYREKRVGLWKTEDGRESRLDLVPNSDLRPYAVDRRGEWDQTWAGNEQVI